MFSKVILNFALLLLHGCDNLKKKIEIINSHFYIILKIALIYAYFSRLKVPDFTIWLIVSQFGAAVTRSCSAFLIYFLKKLF